MLFSGRAAFKSGSSASGYKTTGRSTCEIIDQVTTPLLDASYFTVKQQYGSGNDGTHRFPLGGSTASTFSTVDQFYLQTYINITSDLLTGTNIGECYLWAKDTQSVFSASGNPRTYIKLKKSSTSAKATGRFNTNVNGNNQSAVLHVELGFYQGNGTLLQTELCGLDEGDTDFTGWNQLLIGWKTQYTFGSGWSTYPGPFWNNGSYVQAYAKLTKLGSDPAVCRIYESGLNNYTGTIDFDEANQVHEYFGVHDTNWANNLTHLQMGPSFAGAQNLNGYNESDSSPLANYYGDPSLVTVYRGQIQSDLNSPKSLSFNWNGSTDAARLANYGPAGDYTADTTGSLTVGTFQ